jgi:hypothetical protein
MAKSKASQSSLLERNGSDHNLVVKSCKCCSNEGANPENPLHPTKECEMYVKNGYKLIF